MGLRDRLTDLRKQAEEAVAEHKDQIQGAMETAGQVVDRKTHGKYTEKIARYGQKASDAVEKLGDQEPTAPVAEDHPQEPPAAAPSAEEPAPDSRTPEGGFTGS